MGQTSTTAVDPIILNYPAKPLQTSGSFNYSLLQQWAGFEAYLLQWLLPSGQTSSFQTSVHQNNLSNIFLSYTGNVHVINHVSDVQVYGPSPNGTSSNTPANDYWTLELSYASNTGPTLQFLYIAFLPNGSVDTLHTPAGHLENATNLLAPTITYLQSTTSTKFDFWQMINWLYVTLYWTMLADLGQAVPTIYPFNGFGNFNFSSPVNYLPTNNILSIQRSMRFMNPICKIQSFQSSECQAGQSLR